MIDCQDRDREAIVSAIAREASLVAVQTLLESAVKAGDSKLVVDASQVLRTVLRGQASSVGVGGRSFVADLMPSYLKTTQTVLARGIPVRVQAGECKLLDCVSCFYESICERISVEKLIQRSRALVEGLKAKREG